RTLAGDPRDPRPGESHACCCRRGATRSIAPTARGRVGDAVPAVVGDVRTGVLVEAGPLEESRIGEREQALAAVLTYQRLAPRIRAGRVAVDGGVFAIRRIHGVRR